MHSYKSKEANILLKKKQSKSNPIMLLHVAGIFNTNVVLKLAVL